MTTTAGPLADLRVLDLAGPIGLYCTKMLADLGADTIKIEPPGGDPSRRRGPFFADTPDPEKSLFWWFMNTSKRGITLDLECPAGRDTFLRLAARADIIVETYAPGYLDSLGLGFAELHDTNSRGILASITAYGQSGPYAQYKSTDLTGQATSGLAHITGWPDTPPVRMACEQGYMVTSLHAVSGILIALNHRDFTGRGQHVDVSMQEAVPFSMQTTMNLYDAGKQIVRRCGSNPRTGPYTINPGNGIFPAKDGWVYTSFKSDGWQALLSWMAESGHGAMLRDERYRDEAARWKDVELVDRQVALFTAAHPKHWLAREGQERRLFFMPVNSPADLANDPQLLARNFFIPVAHPEIGREVRYPGPPFHMEKTPYALRRRAPLIGEHNSEVLEEAGLAWRAGQEPHPPAPSPSSMERGWRQPRVRLGGPLAGTRVMDFSWVAAGPGATRVLAMHGAEVIKIESTKRLDGVRRAEPVKNNASLNASYYFAAINPSKRGITLNLSTREGAEAARSLVAITDVVVNNFGPGVMERVGLGYEDCRKIRPDVIYLSMPVMGPGPHRHHRGVGVAMLSASGLQWLTGFSGRPPGAYAMSFPDATSNPYHAAAATLAALHHRTVTGQGQAIELSQYESTICLAGTALLEQLANGRCTMGQKGNRSDSACPHGIFRCKGNDRWCAIAVTNDEEWGALCGVIGRTELKQDPRFKTFQDRKRHEDQADTILQEWTCGRAPEEVMTALQKAGVPAGVVESAEDLMTRDPQLQARGHWVELAHPELGKSMYEAPAYKLSAAPPDMRRAPLMGEHNDYVYQELLGISQERADELLVKGVFE